MLINPDVAAIEAPPIPLAHAWAARYDGGRGPLLDLCQAVPGYPPHPELLSRAAAEAADPAAARYGLIPGDLALRQALAAEMSATYAGTVAPEQLAITAGCNQAFFLALMTLARRGDNVLLPLPWFWNHQQSCTMLGIEPRPLLCTPDSRFVPDSAHAETLIDANTRAILLITPNNPTGAVYPPETIAAFHALCARRGIALILDETYRDFLPAEQDRAHGLFARPDWPDHLVQIQSFSKSYCIPGHRLGAIAAAPALVAEFAKVLDCLHICPQRPGQATLAWAIEALRGWRGANRALMNERAAAMRTMLAGLEPLGWALHSLGAYFAYVRHPFGTASAAVAERLATEGGAVCLPGSAFGPGGDAHLRLAFANLPLDRVPDLGERLRSLH